MIDNYNLSNNRLELLRRRDLHTSCTHAS